MDNKKLLLGVICSEIDNTEQKQLISGITETALKMNTDIAVISNVYNPDNSDSELFCENKIYDLILSKDLNGIILLAESVVNPELKKLIKEKIMERTDIPVIAIGTKTAEFETENITFINTDDEQDIFDITSHLIETHNFSDIDILTGNESLKVSHQRVKGYRNSLEKHRICFDEAKVHFGNFWMNSGEELARKYINKELHKPQALICANDYMAYGFLDEMCEQGKKIPEYITVIGYEDVKKRMKHSPVLTTYRRNRKQLGSEAVRLIIAGIRNKETAEFVTPHGDIICGDSCPCGKNIRQYNEELKEIRELEMFEYLNLMSLQEEKLSKCSNLEEFVSACSGFCFLIRNANQFTFCLSENWYDSNAENMSDIMVCRTVNAGVSEPNFNRMNISAVTSRNSKPSVYYFNPIFFSKTNFGYLIIKYDSLNSPDIIYRSWLKCISNSLEFLRMKNDIKYLSQCQNLSDTQDSLTGLYSENGLIRNLRLKASDCKNDDRLVMIMIKTAVVSRNFNTEQQNVENRVNSEAEAGNCFKLIADGNEAYCARTGDNTFVFAGIGRYPQNFCSVTEDKIKTLISHSPLYSKIFGVHSLISTAFEGNPSECDFAECLNKMKSQLFRKTEAEASKQFISKYNSFSALRNDIYSNPEKEYPEEKLCRRFELSKGYFRTLYKDYFGVSLHQDIVSARISKAKYLLLSTNMNIQSIAYSCGYDDEKYFMSRFKSITGSTPSKYRK